MRLSQQQVGAIGRTFNKFFVHGNVVLFGSRVDDAKKGGDIDVYIEPNQQFDDLFSRKIAFLVELKSLIGDQKIDLVLAPFASADLKAEIARTGVTLWQN